MTSRLKTYTELSQLNTLLGRYEYLALRGNVGESTFGFERWINQNFYTSMAWRRLRRDAIARDLGCDLGVEGNEIHDKVIVHHMNPLVAADIIEGSELALSLEYLICVRHPTHNAIHYGDASLLPREHIPRRPGDTNLW